MPTHQVLDQQLDSYQSAAAGLLEAKERTRFLGKLALHSAAVGAAMAMAPSAEAAVIYSGVQNINLTHPGTTTGYVNTGVDLDSSGGTDAILDINRDTSGFFRAYLTAFNSTVGGVLATSGGTFVRNLAPGYLIGSGASNFVGFATLNYNGTSGQFVGATGLAGLRFQRAGNTHYAWLRLAVSSNGDAITLIDWAWEDVADQAIAAGALSAVPEPTSAALLGLGLLAVGARGVRSLRRARGAAAAGSGPAA